MGYLCNGAVCVIFALTIHQAEIVSKDANSFVLFTT
jgi:hypothetical protein